MIEVKNKLYTQRFYAENLQKSDIFKAVHYTQYLGDKTHIPFWYKKNFGHTGVQNISMNDEQLLGTFKSNTRNEVRRAEKEGCLFETNIGFEKFVDYYNRFAKEKGLTLIDVGTLTKYNRIITTASYIINQYGEKQILAMHATLYSEDDKSATLMYSCSPRLEDGIERKLIGWGNRFLHFQDFIFFRDMGAERYEWNGININPQTPERYSIGKFKLGFGCEPIESIGLETPMFVIMHFLKFNILNKLKR